MDTSNVLCEKKEYVMLTELFEDYKVLLQDSDAIKEKEHIKNCLKKMTDNTTYMILGDKGVGKTSLIRAVFHDMMSPSDYFDGDMCEYRWGEQELLTPPNDGMCKHFITSESMKGISVIDTNGIDSMSDEFHRRIQGQLERSNAVFVVFDAGNIRSPKLWDVIEGCPEKKMIFFLTKCDLISESDLTQSISKMHSYIQDSGISAPVFAVTVSEEKEIAETVPLEYVRTYIREHIIGKNPMLNNQMENLQEMKKVIIQLRDSLFFRKKQYLSDYEILQKINRSMDDFVLNHKNFLARFIDGLTSEVNKDIDSYEREIISKLDPYKIKERFRNKEDFQTYLDMVNENYKTMMNDSVNRKTIEAIKSCLRDLEIVFQESVGYFNTRENILALNDKFYGSLATGRRQMVNETREVIVSTNKLYRTLSDASETLFMQIWEARRKYDAKVRVRDGASHIVGLGAGVTGGAAAVTALFAKKALEELTMAGVEKTVGSVFLTVSITHPLIMIAAILSVGAIGYIALNHGAEKIFDPRMKDKLEETTRKCIEEFKAEVNNTRIRMIGQIKDQITEIFENELSAADGCFTEFRMTVNIDERNIPMLEQRLSETEALLMKLETL